MAEDHADLAASTVSSLPFFSANGETADGESTLGESIVVVGVPDLVGGSPGAHPTEAPQEATQEAHLMEEKT